MQPRSHEDTKNARRISSSPVGSDCRSERVVTRVIAEIAITCTGAVILACALAANQAWLDRHFMPSWFLPRRWYVLIETGVRIAMAAFGLVLALFARPRVARLAARAPALAVHATIAAVLALGASELVLRRVHLVATEWLVHDEEPRRRPDPRLGWTFVPARTGHNIVGGRDVEYAFDAAGYRVRRVDEPVDPGRPTIVFTGESVMFGEGLTWEESVPAQVGAMMGTQSANLAVHGYGTDQAFLRLQNGRNLDADRPHLGPGLIWLTPERGSRLASIARMVAPYRSDAVIERGVMVTREVLRATTELARTRGATPLIVVPQFGPEEPAEWALRRRVLDDGGLSYLRVEIDAGWRLPWDRHPNARAANAIAAAVAARLRGR